MKRWSEDATTGEITSYEYQNMWYENESAQCSYRQKDYLAAFKFYHYIDLHLATMVQDFYDFYFYTMRKFQFRSFISTSKMQESLKKNTYVVNGLIGMLKVLEKFYNKATSDDQETRDKFNSWLKEQVEKHPDREETFNDWKEYTPSTDPLESEYDPLAAKALKKIVDKGIANEACDRITDGLKLNSTDERIHYKAVEWYLRAKKYTEALNSLKFLHLNHSENPHTVMATAHTSLFFSNEEVRKTIKEKQLETIDQSLNEYLGGKSAKEFFESSLNKPGDLMRQRFYIQGTIKAFKETVSKQHFAEVSSILSSHSSSDEKKELLARDLPHALILVKYAPDDYREDLIQE